MLNKFQYAKTLSEEVKAYNMELEHITSESTVSGEPFPLDQSKYWMRQLCPYWQS